ncbi:phage holin family protein [Roseibium salinum]|nr:phage holin family protein [Roseibium salinum]
MLYNVATSIAAKAGDTVKRAARSAVFAVVGLFFLTFALIFAAIALFLWLETFMEPPLAGLVIAMGFLVVALMFFLLARRQQRPKPVSRRPAQTAEGALKEAEALGRNLGKNVSGYPMVLTAFMIGILLGVKRGK